MQRTTGWDGAIVAIMNARGQTPRGAKPVEVAVPPQLFADELKKRGFSLTEEVSVEPLRFSGLTWGGPRPTFRIAAGPSVSPRR